MLPNRHPSLLILAVLCTFSLARLHAAEQANPAEARLREALKNSMLQLRAAESERANLQAEKAQNEQEKQDRKSVV